MATKSKRVSVSKAKLTETGEALEIAGTIAEVVITPEKDAPAEAGDVQDKPSTS